MPVRGGSFKTRKSKAYRRHYYLANQTKGLQEKKSNYQQNADSRQRADKWAYEVNSEKKHSMPRGGTIIQRLVKCRF